MQRRLEGSPPGLALVALLGPLLGGCVADGQDGGIFVVKNVQAGDGCRATAMNTEAGINHGSLDLLLHNNTGYLFIAQMKSRITALAGQEDQRTIITTGAKIDITFPNSQLFSADELANLKASGLTHLKQLFSASLPPNGTIVDAGFELIPAALIEQITKKPEADPKQSFRLEAVATFTVEGDMAGQTVSSQAFTYPVTIGNNVSVNFVTCPMPKGSTPRTGYSCNPAQDGIVDCCKNGDNTAMCPATVTM